MLTDDTFGPGGFLSQKFPGYEPRKGQVAMAKVCEKTFEMGNNLLIEAPCGVGKSLAYLVPAIERAKIEKRPAIIVTAAINLQEQLIRKDLPMLQEILPVEFTFAMAKGINNYLCVREFEKSDGKLHLHTVQEKTQWNALREWYNQTKTGDLSDLPIELLPSIRELATVSADNCLGKQYCSRFDDCFAYRARAGWKRADVIVTNYHLFFIDRQLKAMKEHSGLFPEESSVVFDEAHKLTDIARSFYGWRITERALKMLAKIVPNNDVSRELEKSVTRFFIQLENYYNSTSYKARIRVPDCVKEGRGLAGLLGQAAASFNTEASSTSDLETRHKLRLRAATCVQHADHILDVMELDTHKSVYFLSKGDRGGVALESKLYELGEVLNPIFSSDTPKVLTSATLATDQGFSLIKNECTLNRCGKECVELSVDSPFDFSDILVCIPALPDPRAKDYADKVSKTVEAVTRVTKGRTLALFTSWKILDSTYNHLKKAKLPYEILNQRLAPRNQLVASFKDNVSSILLGTESFWTGVDVQGEALSCVVIDRLPFLSPEDPIMDLVTEQDPNGWFHLYSLPKSILQFKQGFGRLKRSKDDKGCVVILDNRILEKPYGKRFLKALPKGVRITTEISDIAEVLK